MQATEAAAKETLGFQAEVKQLLKLMIHSLYSNKEIFLRELISNASDALDKLRFESIAQPALMEGHGELAIRVSVDKAARTITVSDNGIGMSRQDAIEHLGTIAKSGTREFFAQLTGDQQKDAQLIGQFGVGFYSSFIVADRVTVVTRRAGAPATDAVRWESDGGGEFSIEPAERAESGTDVTLHLREGEDELLEGFRLKSIVSKYSDHISAPIRMRGEKWDKDKGEMVAADEDETVNQANALWARAKADITDEQYQEFYRHVSHDFGEPLAWTHSRVEGRTEYTQLLYIPARAPFDLWDRNQRHGIKLYVKRVFIMDDAEQLMPPYLRFVRGVIDSSDLPLNVSREILQESRDVKAIREGSDQARAGTARGPGREPEGQVRHVLEGIRPGAEGRHWRRCGQPRTHRGPAALCLDGAGRRRADGRAEGLRGAHERRPGQDLLRDGRHARRRALEPASGDLPQEGDRSAAADGAGRRVDAFVPARIRRQGSGLGRQGRARSRDLRRRAGKGRAAEDRRRVQGSRRARQGGAGGKSEGRAGHVPAHRLRRLPGQRRARDERAPAAPAESGRAEGAGVASDPGARTRPTRCSLGSSQASTTWPTGHNCCSTRRCSPKAASWTSRRPSSSA